MVNGQRICMRDPHVESLRYRVVSRENFSYHQPPPVEVEYTEFSGRLEDGLLTCNMKQHYSAVKEAEKAIEPYLRAWEIWTDIKYGRKELRFEPLPNEAKIIDRNPPPPGPVISVDVTMSGGLVVGGSFIESAERSQYPSPPKDFKFSPDVETLHYRYEMYLEGKDSLQAMAYFCLTLAEARGGSGSGRRAKAASRLNISTTVLAKLGQLSTDKGENKTARKVQRVQMPLNGRESVWIEAAIKMLILRLGEIDSHSSASLSQITMASLPTLGS
jgi:hypothetical protein